MRNITDDQVDGSHGADRCGYSPIHPHDSFPAIDCGHSHYPNLDVRRGVAAQSALSLQRECGYRIMNPLDDITMG